MGAASDSGYKKMYFALFNRISDAVMALDTGNISLARNLLCAAQQEGEALYLEKDPDGEPEGGR